MIKVCTLAAAASTALTATVVAPTIAHAQFAGEAGNVAVRERPRPEYEAQGVRVGTFIARPVLELRGRYEDNVFARTDDDTDPFTGAALPIEEDFVFNPILRIDVTSDWANHELTVFGVADYEGFAELDDENNIDGELGFAGRYDVGVQTALSFGASFSQEHQARTSTNDRGSVEPISFTVIEGNGGVTRTFDQLTLIADGFYRTTDFDDAVNSIGLAIDQDDRDNNLIFGRARASYAISPDTALFVQGAVNDREFDVDLATAPAGTRDRSSSGVEFLAGASFDITRLARGEISLGYLSQEFDNVSEDPVGVDPVTGEPVFEDDTLEGLDAAIDVDWFPSPLTTVSFGVGREVNDAGIPGTSGILSSSYSVGVDHELFRNVILSGGFNYVTDEFQGIDRDDDRYGIGVGATYLLNRTIGVDVSYGRLSQDSSGANEGRDFDTNTVSATVRFAR